jgi:hypothetical protein
MSIAMKKGDYEKVLKLLSIIRKYSSNTESDVAQEYTQKYLDFISGVLQAINKASNIK